MNTFMLKKSLKTALCAVAFVGLGFSSTAFAESPTEASKTTKTAPAKKDWKGKWAKMSEQERLEAMDKHLDKRMARLTKELKLSTKQAKSMRQLFESRRTEVMDAKTRNKGNRKAGRKEVMKIKQSYKTKIAALLTADQKTAYQGMKKARHQKRHQRRMAWMKTNLKLSAKQVTQIEAIHKDSQTKIQAAIAAQKGDRAKARPQIKAIRKASKQKVKALLTADQQKTLKSHKGKRKGHRRGHHKGHGHHKGPF